MRIPRLTVRLLMILVGIVGLILGGIAWYLRGDEHYFIIENRSGEPIAQLQVSTHSSRANFVNIADGKWVRSRFRAFGHPEFYVAGNLADGTKLRAGFGYVKAMTTHSHPIFTFRPGGTIEFGMEGNEIR